MSEDVLEQYEFHVKIAEEDVRDGDATAWERVVAGLAAALRAEREHNTHLANSLDKAIHNLAESGLDIQRMGKRVAELETRLNPPCPDPGIDAFYLDASADFDVTYLDGKPTGKVVLE